MGVLSKLVDGKISEYDARQRSAELVAEILDVWGMQQAALARELDVEGRPMSPSALNNILKDRGGRKIPYKLIPKIIAIEKKRLKKIADAKQFMEQPPSVN